MFKKKSNNDASINMGILKRIWREHTKKYIWTLLGAAVITSLTALTEAYAVSLLKPIFDNGFIDRDNKVLLILCSQIIGLYLIKGWFYFAQTLILSRVSTKTVQAIQQRVFTHLISLDIGYFNKHSSGQMLARIINDCNAITNIAINFITHIFKDLITCIAMFGLTNNHLLGLLYHTHIQLSTKSGEILYHFIIHVLFTVYVNFTFYHEPV